MVLEATVHEAAWFVREFEPAEDAMLGNGLVNERCSVGPVPILERKLYMTGSKEEEPKKKKILRQD